MDRLVVASAAYFESAELISRLRGRGLRVTQIITGVGLTESSMVAGRLRDLVVGRDVIFCCTGGVVGTFSGVKVYQAVSAELRPFDVRSGAAYILEQFDPRLKLQGASLGLPPCEVLGSLGVSTGNSPIAGDGITRLETIELYGVARAWSSVASSFTGVVAATNATGPSAHREWKEHFLTAARETARVVSEGIEHIGRK